MATEGDLDAAEADERRLCERGPDHHDEATHSPSSPSSPWDHTELDNGPRDDRENTPMDPLGATPARPVASRVGHVVAAPKCGTKKGYRGGGNGRRLGNGSGGNVGGKQEEEEGEEEREEEEEEEEEEEQRPPPHPRGDWIGVFRIFTPAAGGHGQNDQQPGASGVGGGAPQGAPEMSLSDLVEVRQGTIGRFVMNDTVRRE